MDFNLHDSGKNGYKLVVFHDAEKAGIRCDAALEILQTKGELFLIKELQNNYGKYLAQAEANEKSATLLRELAYNTEKTVTFGGETMTVTEAAQLWQYYAAENNEKANELSHLIAIEKKNIREKYPD